MARSASSTVISGVVELCTMPDARTANATLNASSLLGRSTMMTASASPKEKWKLSSFPPIDAISSSTAFRRWEALLFNSPSVPPAVYFASTRNLGIIQALLQTGSLRPAHVQIVYAPPAYQYRSFPETVPKWIVLAWLATCGVSTTQVQTPFSGPSAIAVAMAPSLVS